ncbi:F0F1 ATP synthase subunit B [Brevibacterium sp. 50QC2O2]|jgi:F-type H+-transporting ATPase subunit b|uniref:F0F1 ATP synthase subunit B n=1 Tax=Brevibacterium TaxID=1696 RepID=UPI00211BAF18|nr:MULTISPECIES: F0F1 ATP synthase subunit B [unclassified Brevibacterium]MCQ9368297.1 F0F1 ATP synthase subunit B [Brevibacterium sp. 91QC2O2]MCQ9384799.1 F0F1 ATP synthase subunit B [Brevibacterium sp. 68QC2CO]MCQ9387561.1 F0F1 ATP synthase subunit B [Brevibacterium sp. 50QC2O2]
MTPMILAAEEAQNPLIPAVYDIVWSAVIFIVLFLIVWKFVIPSFKKTLDERAARIQGGIEKAEKVQAEADAALQEYQQQLNEGRAEAARLREEARADGEKIRAELKDRASAEADRITENAKAQIEAERQAALVSLRSEVGTLATDLASKIVGESLADDAKSAAVVDRFIADLDAQTPAKVSGDE